MSISRRRFCITVAGTSVALPLAVVARDNDQDADDSGDNGEPGRFRHGVASGDPLADRVILWTRITPVGADEARIPVEWQLASDPELQNVVTRGLAMTDADRDFTVKIDATGLQPGTTYYYRFRASGRNSPIGRTRTLPVGRVERLRLAVASCSNYPFGFFNGYALIAQRADLDAVLHLGDYLYEYANGTFGDGADIDRIPDPNKEIVTLADYRRRHAQYKTDPDLQEAHRQHPFITVWDDHESTNNSWENGAENHNPDEGEGEWAVRKARSIQAYHEWLPIRDVQPARQEIIYRTFQFGDLMALTMLDTRLVARDQQAPAADDTTIIDDPTRTLLGDTQESWLFNELLRSRALGTRWRLLGQQVMFGQLSPGDPEDPQASGPGRILNPDQWDGYAPARERVLSHIRANEIDNVVVLTGDIHSSWALDLSSDPFNASAYNPETGEGSLATEFVTPGITSPGAGAEDFEQAQEQEAGVADGSPHMKYVDLFHRGYMLLDIDRERVQAEWYHLETVREPSREQSVGAVFKTDNGANHVEAVDAPSGERADAPALAPQAAPSKQTA